MKSQQKSVHFLRASAMFTQKYRIQKGAHVDQVSKSCVWVAQIFCDFSKLKHPSYERSVAKRWREAVESAMAAVSWESASDQKNGAKNQTGAQMEWLNRGAWATAMLIARPAPLKEMSFSDQAAADAWELRFLHALARAWGGRVESFADAAQDMQKDPYPLWKMSIWKISDKEQIAALREAEPALAAVFNLPAFAAEREARALLAEAGAAQARAQNAEAQARDLAPPSPRKRPRSL